MRFGNEANFDLCQEIICCLLKNLQPGSRFLIDVNCAWSLFLKLLLGFRSFMQIAATQSSCFWSSSSEVTLIPWSALKRTLIAWSCSQKLQHRIYKWLPFVNATALSSVKTGQFLSWDDMSSVFIIDRRVLSCLSNLFFFLFCTLETKFCFCYIHTLSQHIPTY